MSEYEKQGALGPELCLAVFGILLAPVQVILEVLVLVFMLAFYSQFGVPDLTKHGTIFDLDKITERQTVLENHFGVLETGVKGIGSSVKTRDLCNF